MIIQNLIMSIFCTIDKTMVTENLQKSKNQRRDSSLPFFMNIVLIKLISQKNLYIDIVIPSYLILLSYFIYFSQATSIVMRCGCNGPFGIQIEGGFSIEQEKKSRELSYQSDNF
jgi:hypothetical protein